MSIADYVLIGLGILVASFIIPMLLDVFDTDFAVNSVKNSATTAIADNVNVTNVAISATQSVGSQVITAMLTASGVEDVKHIIEKKVDAHAGKQ